MADKKISELTTITGANTASGDLFVIVDVDANETKKITRDELTNALELTDFDNIDINGGTIDGVTIGGASAGAGTFTTLNTTGSVVFNEAGANVDFRVEGDTDANLLFVDASADAVGIGETSPGVKLDVSYADTAYNAGIRVKNTSNNSASQSKVYVVNDADEYFSLGRNSTVLGSQSALFSTGAYPIEFYTNSTLKATLNSSGNLGLGVTPSAWTSTHKAYQLQGGGSLYNNGADGYLNLANNFYYDGTDWRRVTAAPASSYLQSSSGHLWSYVGTGTADSVSGFPSLQMTLDASGNLGLGVTPSAWSAPAFQISRGSQFADTGSVAIQHNAYYDSGWKYIASSQGALQFQAIPGTGFLWNTAASGTAGNAITFTQAMTLDASGRLQIAATNNTATNAKLVVGTGNASTDGVTVINTGDANVNALTLSNWDGGSTSFGPRITFDNSGQGAFTIGCSDGANNFDICQTWGTPQVRIDSSGNLLVGTTSALGANAERVAIEHTYPVSGMSINQTTANTTYAIEFRNQDNLVGNVTCTTTATAFNTSSDYRLKNITGPITNSGEYIDSLNPVEGTWKADGATFVGLIAHEVQEVSRTPVATGEKDGEEMQGMDYSSAEIIANLIAEVKALRQRVAALESI